MKCPFCHSTDTRVVDSRPVEEGAALRRRRGCESCGARFTTHERHQSAVLMVVKKDGRREEFSLPKLRGGLAKACNKRPVATEDIERSAGEIEAQLRRDGGAEVSSDRVGELVMEKLFSLDQVAYVRFASVYQRFDDVKRFAQILERISRRGRGKTAPDKVAPGTTAPGTTAPGTTASGTTASGTTASGTTASGTANGSGELPAIEPQS